MTGPSAPAAALEAKQRVELGLEALRRGLGPYVATRMERRYGQHWRSFAKRARGGDPDESLDAYALLGTVIDRWSEIFKDDAKLRRARSFVSLAMDARNRVAHFSGEMSGREALRYLDAMREVSAAVGAVRHADVIEQIYEDQRRADNTKTGPPPVAPASGEAVGERREAGRMHGPPAGAVSRASFRSRSAIGKYEPLFHHLTALEVAEWHASFREIEAVLGFALPASARRHPAWWSNQKSGAGPIQSRAWQEAGWRTGSLNLAVETIVFERAWSAQGDGQPNRSA
ncbi:MAG: Swt1 family HEPN domain-containing protein [Rhodospirillaceae bacterium]|nr:Swt1 family HEPN domain-containing protein [Rhodospirillaceae bacterium]MDE0616496.1 Swt1 family HEPN domain-containing protein [Rhodospirillaceae bacterium]